MEDTFRAPLVMELENEKAAILEEARRQAAQIDERISSAELEETYMRDLLTTGGDPLKDATKKALEVLIGFAGASDLTLLDVDADPALRGNITQLAEDLRIERGDDTVLIDIAGREQFVRQPSINQLALHRRRYLAASGKPATTVHSLLIANVNYQGGLDPRRRGDMFGSGTAEAEERLRADGFAAFSTYDLYRLIRGLQRREYVLGSGDLWRLLTTQGILAFEEYQRSLDA